MIKTLDLFAGIGGMTLAAEQAGLSVSYAIGISEAEAEIYRKNFGGRPYLIAGKEKIDFRQIPEIECILGQIPFQCLSSASYGREQGRNTNLDWVRKLICDKMPKCFVFVISDRKTALPWFSEERLIENGYNIWTNKIDSREATGMPVCDKKRYLVGIRKELGKRFKFPDIRTKYVYDIKELMQEDSQEELPASVRKKVLYDPEARIYNNQRIGYGYNAYSYVPGELIKYNMTYPALLADNGNVRRISVRELARTKFFPDEFIFEGANRTELYRGLTRSVNVGVAEAVIRQVLAALDDFQTGEQHPIHREKAAEEHTALPDWQKNPKRKTDILPEETEKKGQNSIQYPSKPAEEEQAKTGPAKSPVTDEKEDKARIFLSYCQKDEQLADLIEEKLMPHIREKYRISRDIRDVKYKESFRKFMESIREHEYVLMILSDRYMKSVNCMYEMMEVLKDSSYGRKLLFFVISDADKKFFRQDISDSIEARVYSPEGQTQYILYWQEEQRKLDEQIKRIGDPMYARMQINRKCRIEKIKLELAEFFEYISDARGLTLEEHIRTEFKEVLEHIAAGDMRAHQSDRH